VGTGSGCIALSLALAKSDAQLTGWDISKDALSVAERNKASLACQNSEFEHCDVHVAQPKTTFAMIVSNPPYIARSEESSLSTSVKSFEPHVALFDDAAVDGLSFYRTLAKKALEWLEPGGILMVECGHTQAKSVGDIFLTASKQFQELTITKDLGGRDRVVSVRRNP
jgi:release factor glutamine methyltransferase